MFMFYLVGDKLSQHGNKVLFCAKMMLHDAKQVKVYSLLLIFLERRLRRNTFNGDAIMRCDVVMML